MIHCCLYVACFLFAITTSFAQIPLGNVSGRLVLENTQFSSFDGNFSCCPEYTSTIGWGLGLGGGIEFALNSSLSLQTSLLVGFERSTFTEQETRIVDGGGTAVTGVFNHNIDVSQTLLGIEPVVLFGESTGGLRFGGGVRLAWIASAAYSQESRIVEPDNIRFENDSRVRDEYAGDVTSASAIDASILARAGFASLLSEDLRLEPFIQLEVGLIPFVAEPSWSRYGVRVGVSLALMPTPEPEVQPLTNPQRAAELPIARTVDPTPQIIESNIIAVAADPEITIEITGVDNQGNKVQPHAVAFKNVLSRVMAPVLPYVFHDEGQAKPRSVYSMFTSSDVASFDLADIATNSTILNLHYQTLNIIGSRMRELSTANLVVIGNGSGSAVEKAMPSISSDRAASVKNYLVDVWGINPQRITTRARVRPQAPSNMNTADGQSENQRTEFESDMPELLEPFLMQDTVLHADLAIMKIAPEIPPNVSIASWSVVTRQGQRELQKFSGQGALPSDGVTWNLADARDIDVKNTEDLTVDVELVLENGERKRATKSLAVTVDYELRDRLEQYNLIVFGYNSADLSSEHMRIIRRVKELLGPDVSVKIVGYADRTGDEQLNKDLSVRRAVAVARALGVPETNASGVGASELLFDNNTPEGRFFCRTVRIFVRSAIR